jgi:hypothetical protein
MLIKPIRKNPGEQFTSTFTGMNGDRGLKMGWVLQTYAECGSVAFTADLEAVKIARHMHRWEDRLGFLEDIPFPVTTRKVR